VSRSLGVLVPNLLLFPVPLPRDFAAPLLLLDCKALIMTEPTKVFVGNLAFKTEQQKLIEEFSAAGAVLGANIITRGPRSLGYGFVEFGNLQDAEKAVGLLNHKSIDGREVNVEIARPKAEPQNTQGQDHQDGNDQPAPRRRRRPRNRSNYQNNNNNNYDNNMRNNNNTNNNNQRQPRRRFRPRTQGQQQQSAPIKQYRPRQNSNNNNFQANNNTQFNNAEGNFSGNAPRAAYFNATDNDSPRRPRRRFRRRTGPREERDQQQTQGQQSTQQGQQPAQRQPRQRRVPVPRKPRESTPSKTTIFVANLPFSVEDNELQSIFAEKFKVVSAYVVKKRNGRSKGFGFVEFENEEAQLGALKAFEGFTLKERPLNVKVALTTVPAPEGGAGTATTTTTSSGAAAPSDEGKTEGGAAASSETKAEEAKPKETEQAATKPAEAASKTETETKAQ